MATIGRLKVGQTLWSLSTTKMGNTTLTRRACHSVVVTAIDPEGKFVEAQWNGNPPRKYYESSVSKWKVNKPEPKGTRGGLPHY